MLRAAAVCFGLAAMVAASAYNWRAALVLGGVWAALGLAQWCLVKVSIESRPRIRTLDYQSGVWGPQEIKRVAELPTEPARRGGQE